MPDTFHHVSITCSDIDRSADFYRLIGFNKVEAEFQDQTCHIKLLTNGSFRVELFQFQAAADTSEIDPIGDFAFLRRVGLTHFAINTNSLERMQKHLSNRNIQCSDCTSARLGNFRYFFTSDPDGNKIEFIAENE